jgi:hypothetical protein
MQTKLRWRLRLGLAVSEFGGSLESGGRYYFGEFSKNLPSVAVKVFSHLIDFEKLNKFCTFNSICKHNFCNKTVLLFIAKSFILVKI